MKETKETKTIKKGPGGDKAVQWRPVICPRSRLRWRLQIIGMSLSWSLLLLLFLFCRTTRGLRSRLVFTYFMHPIRRAAVTYIHTYIHTYLPPPFVRRRFCLSPYFTALRSRCIQSGYLHISARVSFFCTDRTRHPFGSRQLQWRCRDEIVLRETGNALRRRSLDARREIDVM